MIIRPKTFYYHFKRDPEQGINHGAYYVLGLGMNTEKRDQHFVVLKPLYYCNPRHIDEQGISYQIRPIAFFDSSIQRDEYCGPRFVEITNPAIISELKKHELFHSDYLDE